MKQRIRIGIPILILIVLVGGYWWWSRQAVAADSQALTGSGTIEAEAVLVSSEVAGRVQRLLVDEGDETTAGALVAQLDPALLEAQRDQAAAGVTIAEANLALVQAGSRGEDIAIAEAAVAQAAAVRDGAAAAYANATAALEDPQQLNTQVLQATAARDQAQRAVDQILAGSRSEDIAAAEAAVTQAETNLQATHDRLAAAKSQAEAAVTQAANSLRNAQDSYSRLYWENRELEELASDLPQARIDAEAAALRAVQNSEATLSQTQIALEYARQAEVSGIATATSQVEMAQATLSKLQRGARSEDIAAARTALSNAQRLLDQTLALRNDPQQLRAAVDGAQAQLAATEAQLAQAQARLALARAGARPEQIQVAEAQLAQARANQRLVEVQLAKTTLKAPRSGIILSRPIHEGEQANPGTLLMTIGSLDTVQLTLYITERDIGRVQQGQRAIVTVDSFPGRTFEGIVSFIAAEAEFTPRNVQTQDERATTVFAVRVELANPDHALKPGMPADATLVE